VGILCLYKGPDCCREDRQAQMVHSLPNLSYARVHAYFLKRNIVTLPQRHHVLTSCIDVCHRKERSRLATVWPTRSVLAGCEWPALPTRPWSSVTMRGDETGDLEGQ
jgi:hypothetical protein